MKAAQSLYDVLNVSPTAEPVVIEAAYRALMKRHHPDHAGTAVEAAAINQAYAVLRSPSARAAYDRRTDAERRDRAAQQHARMIALGSAPERPRANLFGWSGWLVAAAACGVLATVPRQGRVASVSEIAPVQAASRSSQPQTAPMPAESAVSMAELDLAAAARIALSPAPSVDEPARPSAPPDVVRRQPAPRPRATKPATPSSGNQPGRLPEIDFLEREGYIY